MMTTRTSYSASRMIASRRFSRAYFTFASWVLFVALVQAQTPAPLAGQSPTRTARMSRRQPCWQQVGLPKEAIEQRRSIEQSTRSQVESVCADSSLTPQQKHQKIKEIRQQAHQQIDAIITPQQQEELRACNAERAGSRPNPPRHQGGRGPGPCGETASAAPAPSEDKTPSEAPEPKQP